MGTDPKTRKRVAIAKDITGSLLLGAAGYSTLKQMAHWSFTGQVLFSLVFIGFLLSYAWLNDHPEKAPLTPEAKAQFEARIAELRAELDAYYKETPNE